MNIIKAIRDEYETETGSRPSKEAAEVILDGRCAQFVRWFEGVGAGYAVANDPQIARHLAGQWEGVECDALRAALRIYDAAESYAAAEVALRALDEGWS